MIGLSLEKRLYEHNNYYYNNIILCPFEYDNNCGKILIRNIAKLMNNKNKKNC